MDKSRETGQCAPVEAVIRQALELMDRSGAGAEELGEEQLDLVVAGMTAPGYRRFLYNAWEKRRGRHGA